MTTLQPPAQEAARLGEFKHYSLAFLDSHLSPARYNITTNDQFGSRFLGLSEATHEQFQYLSGPLYGTQIVVGSSIGGYLSSPPTSAFFMQ